MDDGGNLIGPAADADADAEAILEISFINDVVDVDVDVLQLTFESLLPAVTS